MLIEQTLEKLTAMKLGAMAEAVQQQPSCGMPPRLKPSTSRTRAGSSASRSLVWAAAHGSPTAITC